MLYFSLIFVALCCEISVNVTTVCVLKRRPYTSEAIKWPFVYVKAAQYVRLAWHNYIRSTWVLREIAWVVCVRLCEWWLFPCGAPTTSASHHTKSHCFCFLEKYRFMFGLTGECVLRCSHFTYRFPEGFTRCNKASLHTRFVQTGFNAHVTHPLMLIQRLRIVQLFKVSLMALFPLHCSISKSNYFVFSCLKAQSMACNYVWTNRSWPR